MYKLSIPLGVVFPLALVSMLGMSGVALSAPPTTAIRYFYDAEGRLKAVYKPSGETALYSWDAAGNLLSIGRKSSSVLSITELAPAEGAVGETVMIDGTGFSTTTGNDTVKFNGTAATVSAATAWALTVKVPSGATTGTVTVKTTTEGPVTSAQTFTVAASPAPQATSISPSVAAAGSSVTVSGSNFEAVHTSNDAVVINGMRAPVTSATSTALHVTVPGVTLGGHTIVTTPYGTVAGPDLYIPPEGLAASKVSPTGRLTVGGSSTTLSFTTAEKVGLGIFDGTAKERVSITASELTIAAGELSIWSPSGKLLYSASLGATEMEPLTLPSTGTYTVMVKPSGTDTGKVKLSAAAIHEVTGSITPTAEGVATHVVIGTPYQNAHYTVEVTANEVVSLATSESTLSTTPVEWLNAREEVVNREESTGAGEFIGATRFPTAGKYTLVVNPVGTATGSLTLMAYNASDVTGSLTLGESKVLTISVPGQVARVTFSATSGERLSVPITEPAFGVGTVALYNSEGSKVTELGFNGEGFIEPLTLASTGTYSLVVTPGLARTGSFKLGAYSVHDVTGSLTPTTGGAVKHVAIEAPGQNARYSVEATANEVVSLVSSESTLGNIPFEWLNSSGEVVSREEGTGTGEYISATRFATAGTYTLVVNPRGAQTGSLTLTAYNASDVTGSLTLGESKVLTISVPGQVARVTFSATSGERLSVPITEPAFGIGTVALYNSEGSKVTELGFNGEGFIEPFTLSSTGTYTLLVTPGLGRVGSFKLGAYSVHDVTGSFTPTTGGAVKHVAIEAPGQNARYSVEATANEVVSLVSSESTLGNIPFEWLNSSGEVVSREEGTGTGEYINATRFATAGTYTLVVNPQGLHTGSLTLTAYNASDVTGTITPDGESVKATIGVPGQVAKITFTGTEGQLLTLKGTESTFTDGWFSVWNPEGSELSGSEMNLSGEPRYEFTPAKTGTYTILVKGYQSITGSVKLTLYIGSHDDIVKPHTAFAAFQAFSDAPQSLEPGGTGQTSRPGSLGESRANVATVAPRAARRPLSHRASAHAVARSSLAVVPGLRQRAVKYAGPIVAAAKPALAVTRPMRAFRALRPSSWQPSMGPSGRVDWQSLQPSTPWSSIAPLRAASAVTALSGQALSLDGLPLRGVRVAVENTYIAAETDSTGRFLLSGLPAGHQVLVIEGETVPGRNRYGSYEYGVDLIAGQTTVLEQTVWLTPLDSAGDRSISSPNTREVEVRTPQIPGLEVRIPAGTVITDAAGHRVRKLNITAIPVDRAPFPLPPFVEVPTYFTIQPGRAYLSKPAEIIYPNYAHLAAGQRVPFWNYDPDGRGWYVYGDGTVSANGKQVIPDPGVRIWQFSGAMFTNSPTPPSKGPKGGSGGGDPLTSTPASLTTTRRISFFRTPFRS